MHRMTVYLSLTAIVIVSVPLSAYSQRKPKNRNPLTPSPCVLTLKDAFKIRGLYLGMTIDEFKRIFPDARLSPYNPNTKFGSEKFDVSTKGKPAFAGLNITEIEFFEGKLLFIKFAYFDYEPRNIGEFVAQAAAKLNLPTAGWTGWTSKDTKTRSLGCRDSLIRIGLGVDSNEGRQLPFLSMIDKTASDKIIQRMTSSITNKIKQDREKNKKRREFKP